MGAPRAVDFGTIASTGAKGFPTLASTSILRRSITVPQKGYATPSPPTKSVGFRGFDSSKLLILKGGKSHVRIIL